MQIEVKNLISGTKLAVADVNVRGGPDSDEHSEWLGWFFCCYLYFTHILIIIIIIIIIPLAIGASMFASLSTFNTTTIAKEEVKSIQTTNLFSTLLKLLLFCSYSMMK